ncbi:MAG: YqaJ viral recombinase family protein [Clostridiales Family XIII bacterium]|jgi:predicted phage-related endonuclease|nr:YqaJ viral recombinase family protein [Clostridiales Family XIII bacterium]
MKRKEIKIIRKVIEKSKETSTVVGDFTAPFFYLKGEYKEKFCDSFNKTIKDPELLFSFSRLKGMDGSVDGIAIGGSDAPTIFKNGEANKYETPNGLYHKKRKYIKEGVLALKEEKENLSPFTKRLFDLGHEAEPYMRAYAIADMNVSYKDEVEKYNSPFEIIDFPYQFKSIKYPHLLANVDGILKMPNGDIGIIEIKTIEATATKVDGSITKESIPQNYEIQMRYYMEILNLDFACLILGYRTKNGISSRIPKYFTIKRDKKLGENILKHCEQFALNVIAGNEPSIIKGKNPEAVRADLQKLKEKKEENSLRESEAYPLYEKYLKKKEIIKHLMNDIDLYKKEILEIENRIIDILALSDKKPTFEDEQHLLFYSFDYAKRKAFDKELCQTRYPKVFEKVYYPKKSKTKTFKVKVVEEK